MVINNEHFEIILTIVLYRSLIFTNEFCVLTKYRDNIIKFDAIDVFNNIFFLGADPCIKSRAGFTALHMAAQEGHGDCVEMLLDRQANVNDQANNGTHLSSISTPSITKHVFDLYNFLGLTPLHLAAQEGRAGAAAALLSAGATIDAQTHDGYTPLHVASHFGQHAVVRLLLDHNADVHSVTNIG